MPLQETSGAASYDAFGGGAAAAVPIYIEDVFSTWLYTGTGATQTITNSIDISTKGGLVWIKGRSGATGHRLTDTARGVTKSLASETTAAEATESTGLTAFGTTGFTIGADADYNTSAATYASWTFREQSKFFDIVTYLGTGANRTVTHNLGSVPGCIIIKKSSAAGTNWTVYHRSLGNTKAIRLNLTDAEATSTTFWNDTTPTSSVFTISTATGVNDSGAAYVAYLFAHDAGGFGLTGTDNVISCGTFTTNGSGSATVNLGYEPQYLLFKRTNASQDWFVLDTMRGFSYGDSCPLYPNLTSVEGSLSVDAALPTATGFVFSGSLSASSPYIYIAIRRGPMKVPTTGTSVFQPITYTGTNVDNRLVDTGIVTDAIIARTREDAADTVISNRLQADYMNFTNLTDDNKSYLDGLDTAPDGKGTSFSSMTGFYVGNSASTKLNQASTAQLAYAFRRAPSFMDVVMYSGTGSSTTVTHNLTVAPELLFVKARSNIQNWSALCTLNSGLQGRLNTTDSLSAPSAAVFGNGTSYVAPTASVFTVGTDNETNASGWTYVAYLFATLAGISKVFSYTGNGSSQTINCGFTGGARFVLIKRTSSTGNWFVWDSARGIVAGNDPYISLNLSNTEVTTNDSVDTDSTGFVVNQVTATNVNVTSATYIGLAIA